MKKNKIILLILVTLLFSGCSVKYDLFINEDLSVNEKVSASENSYTLETETGVDPKTAANSLYDYYRIEGVKYSVSTVEKGSIITSKTSTSFNSLEDYEDYFKSDIAKEVNITRTGSNITLEFKQDVPLNDYSSKSLIYDSIEVNINVPFKVIENNADKISGNTYTWNIKKDGSLKDIKITFDKDRTETSRKFDLGFLEINVQYSVLLACGIVLIILVIVLFVYIKNKKNNKF